MMEGMTFRSRNLTGCYSLSRVLVLLTTFPETVPIAPMLIILPSGSCCRACGVLVDFTLEPIERQHETKVRIRSTDNNNNNAESGTLLFCR